MAYIPFDPSYSSLRTPAYVAREYARRTAVQSRVNDIVVGGNQVMGGLIADCCNDPQYGGQDYYATASSPYGTDSTLSDLIAPATSSPAITGGSASNSASGLIANNPDVAALAAATSYYPLTPVDILTGTYGFPIRRDGRAWPRPRMPRSQRTALVNAFPNFGPSFDTSDLVPPCPCSSNGAVSIAVPGVAASGSGGSAGLLAFLGVLGIVVWATNA